VLQFGYANETLSTHHFIVHVLGRDAFVRLCRRQTHPRAAADTGVSDSNAVSPYPCSTDRNTIPHHYPDTRRHHNSDAYFYVYPLSHTHCYAISYATPCR
jgi:hypothetical protein